MKDLTKKSFILGIIITSSVVLSTVVSSCISYKYSTYKLERELELYKAYYVAADSLLGELDAKYTWCDAFDPYEFYEAEYNLREFIKQQSPK